jgi:hypothetical protein
MLTTCPARTASAERVTDDMRVGVTLGRSKESGVGFAVAIETTAMAQLSVHAS